LLTPHHRPQAAQHPDASLRTRTGWHRFARLADRPLTQREGHTMADVPSNDLPRVEAPSNSAVADPAPLGLAAFALTTFLLSAKNAGWTHGGDAWLGYALAYGGIGQLLAGMWEFRRNNTFGATAFSTYGAFWIGLFFYIRDAAGTSKNVENDLGWILLAFAIFNLYMLICAARVNVAVFAVFLTLEITEILLFVGNFQANTNIIKVGGIVGIVTAACAWYASFAGVNNSLGGRRSLPVGSPMDF
jgi:succinate-acetate transporter protein